MTVPNDNRQWYALYTRPRSEKKVAFHLECKQVAHYLPLIKTLRQWSDRKKVVEVPLIRSYIFTQVGTKEFHSLYETFGVVKIVQFQGIPAPIPDWQIENLKILLKSGQAFERDYSKFQQGDFVVITKGSLQGLKGTVAIIKGKKKLVIQLDVLNVNFTVDIHPAMVDLYSESLV